MELRLLHFPGFTPDVFGNKTHFAIFVPTWHSLSSYKCWCAHIPSPKCYSCERQGKPELRTRRQAVPRFFAMATMPTKNKYRKMIRRVTSESSLKARRGSPRNRRFRSAKSRMRSRSDADKSGPGSLSVDTELQSQDHTSKAVSSALHGQEGMSNDDRPTFTSAVDSNNEVDSVSPGFLPPMLSKYASADAAPLLSKYSQTSPKREHEVSFTSLPNIALPRMESVAEMPTKSSTLSKPSSPSHNFELSNVSGLSSNPRKSRRNIEPIDTRAADPTPPPVKSMFAMKDLFSVTQSLMLSKKPSRNAVWRQKASYVGKEAVKAFYDMYRSGPSTNYGAVSSRRANKQCCQVHVRVDTHRL